MSKQGIYVSPDNIVPNRLEHVVGATYNGYEGILHQQHYLE